MKISIIIPTYNEADTVTEVLGRIARVALEVSHEIIVVDDGSTDKTADILSCATQVRLIRHEKNMGKGAAVLSGFRAAKGDIVLIQDADLEYDPADYPRLLHPILTGRADVVFGSRFRGEEQRVLYFWHYVGNQILTLLSNMFTNLNLSDMETGYKVFSREVVMSLIPNICSKRFGIEPELTARVAHAGWRIYEVPINYYGRTYKEGKKIGWRDGIAAIWAIVYFNIFDR